MYHSPACVHNWPFELVRQICTCIPFNIFLQFFFNNNEIISIPMIIQLFFMPWPRRMPEPLLFLFFQQIKFLLQK